MKKIRRTGDTLFDGYFFVDWSANSKKKRGKDSIWIAEAMYDDAGVLGIIVENPGTRAQARELILDRLLEHVSADRRILIGFDFPYGYPNEWNLALNVRDGNWNALWELISNKVHDASDNANNRWEVANALNGAGTYQDHQPVGPYWGVPQQRALRHLCSRKPPWLRDNVPEFREIERSLMDIGKFPRSVWQLFYRGSVGSQAIVGIPVLDHLRYHQDLKWCSAVWPFETGWQCQRRSGPFVLHAEIWPGAIIVDRGLHPTADAAQVMSYALWAARHDVCGTLAARFDPFNGNAPAAYVQNVEGWILH